MVEDEELERIKLKKLREMLEDRIAREDRNRLENREAHHRINQST